MGEYDFIIDAMQWSYSRLSFFHTCKYGWYTQYIECKKGEQNAASQYGTLCHKILEKYFSGELLAFQLADYFAEHFNLYVTYDFPVNKYVDLRENYFNKGMDFFNNICFIAENYEVLGVEKEVHFALDGNDFVGYIDLLLRDKKSGKIIIVDHKSADIRFKKNGEISKTDIEKVNGFKHQLYLYCVAVKEEYGEFPDQLVWNLFKENKVLKIDFDIYEYKEAIRWALGTIAQIKEEFLWNANPDYYFCNNICNFRNEDCPYKAGKYKKDEKG